MIGPEHDLPISQQAEVLGISRGTAYYQSRPTSAENLWLMRQIDEHHLHFPVAGSRMLPPPAGVRGSLNQKQEQELPRKERARNCPNHWDHFRQGTEQQDRVQAGSIVLALQTTQLKSPSYWSKSLSCLECIGRGERI